MVDEKYPLAWPGPRKPFMTEEESTGLRCAEPGCNATSKTPGGLRNTAFGSGSPIWRCAAHRKELDHSSHREDLRLATQRAIDSAAQKEQKRILDYLQESYSGNRIHLLMDELETKLKAKSMEVDESNIPKGD